MLNATAANSQSSTPRSILITGASSGIGAALAKAYAGPGCRLALGGRDENRLDEIAAACKAMGADADPCRVNVTDRDAMAAWIADADGRAPLDLIIANAGISGGSLSGISATSKEIFAVNVDGVLNSVLPAIELMRPRQNGQIALMSSLAGFRGLPTAPAYAASKAAVRSWGEGLRGALKPDGIRVSVICPGFVRTPLIAKNPFPMPMVLEPDRAAALIKEGLAKNRGRIVFPLRLYLAVRLLSALPLGLSDRLLTRFRSKEL